MKPDRLSDEYLLKAKASLVDSSLDFIGIADADGKLIYLNDAGYVLMGYSADDHPTFETIADVHANDFDKFALEQIQPAVFASGFWNGTGYLRHRDGHAVEVSQLVFPVYDENGTTYGTGAIMKDQSAITEANALLTKNTELFQKVLDSSLIGIVLINMTTNIIEMANKHTQNMLQLPVERIVGQKCYDVLCHRDLSICPHINERDRETIVAERFIQRQDGTLVPVIKSGTWITLDDQPYLVDTLVDITIQKELENNLLEAKIAAEAANRSKSEFLSRMSHEMRTPLTAVLGMTQLAHRSDDLASLKEAIKVIEVSATHLLDLINDVLDLSKIEEGKLELSVTPFSLNTLIQKVVSLIEMKAKEKHLAFTTDLQAHDLPALSGDAMRLSQVLLNFLSNAVKFTPDHGAVTLSVREQGHSEQGVSLYFGVEDTGIGISKEQLSRLFNPFVQADGSISRTFGGTGLGLVISKRIVNLMGADIEVQSDYGHGSTFSFVITLPFDEAGQLPQEEGLLAPEQMEGLFIGKRALLVDDIEINRVVAAQLLSITGITTQEAANGYEAVQMANTTPYDIILMDVQMPVMDGYEATRQIRGGHGLNAATPIVAMSANVFTSDEQQSFAVGMQGHIGKPIELPKLVTLLHRLFTKPTLYTPLDGDPSHPPSPQGPLPFDQLREAMKARDYATALQASKALQLQALALNQRVTAAYAGHVFECLARADYPFAQMYLNDLIGAYLEGK